MEEEKLGRVPVSLLSIGATTYVAVVALAYHASFWSTFNLNILHYAGWSDFLRSALALLG